MTRPAATFGRVTGVPWVRRRLCEVFPAAESGRRSWWYFPLDETGAPTGDHFATLRELEEWAKSERPAESPVHPLPLYDEVGVYFGGRRVLGARIAFDESDRLAATTPPPVRVIHVQREWGISDPVLALSMGLAVREMEMLKRGYVYQSLPQAAFHLARLGVSS